MPGQRDPTRPIRSENLPKSHSTVGVALFPPNVSGRLSSPSEFVAIGWSDIFSRIFVLGLHSAFKCWSDSLNERLRSHVLGEIFG